MALRSLKRKLLFRHTVHAFCQQFVQPVDLDVTVESVNKRLSPPFSSPAPPPLYGVQQLSPVEYILLYSRPKCPGNQRTRSDPNSPLSPII